jgi:hypothetical protein
MVKGPYSGDVSALALLYWPAIASEDVAGVPLLGNQQRSKDIKGDELVIDDGKGRAGSLFEGNQVKVEGRKSDEKVTNEGRGNAAIEENCAGAGQESAGSALGNGGPTGSRESVEEAAIMGADASGGERRERPTLLAGEGLNRQAVIFCSVIKSVCDSNVQQKDVIMFTYKLTICR